MCQTGLERAKTPLRVTGDNFRAVCGSSLFGIAAWPIVQTSPITLALLHGQRACLPE